MPSAADTGGSNDSRLNSDALKQLEGHFAGKYTTQAYAEEVLSEMRFPRRLLPTFREPREFWGDIFTHVADDPALQGTLRATWRRRSGLDSAIDELLGGGPPPEADARADAGPPRAGCHVIMLTTNDSERDRVRQRLEDEGLEPRSRWQNSEMTSYVVNDPDLSAVQQRILANDLLRDSLFKVIPGEPDGLLPQVTVKDKAGGMFPMRDVPIQFTVNDLAASAARLHPAAGSRFDPGEAYTAVRVNGGRLAPGSTLHACGLWSTGDTVSIDSVSFAAIRVVFVGATPRQPAGDGGISLDPIDVEGERNAISAVAKEMHHIELVESYLNAQQRDLRKIIRLRPDIIHMACHGEGNKLILQDEHDPRPVPAEWFAERLIEFQHDHGFKVSGIVLNACSGEIIGPILAEVVGTVIAHEHALDDPVAVRFAEEFYRELAGLPILGSAARSAASDYDGDGGLGAKVQIFPQHPRGSW